MAQEFMTSGSPFTESPRGHVIVGDRCMVCVTYRRESDGIVEWQWRDGETMHWVAWTTEEPPCTDTLPRNMGQ